VRVFVDEGAPMAHLLGRLAAGRRTGHGAPSADLPPPYLDQLARAFQPRGTLHVARKTPEAAGGAELVEPLSDRELQVLRLLATGKSNQQIADELVVVIDTVKKHVGHILNKLGAANRTQAVARARALGLLR
jgi:LuxR family maltose regulon positive regulatory protein